MGEAAGSLLQPPGQIANGLGLTGDPDGVQGNPQSSFSKQSSSTYAAAPAPGPSENEEGWGAVWARRFAGLLQRIGFRY